jgi:PilZ domain
VGEPPQLHECTLEDISINGASINLPSSVDLAKQFNLLLTPTGTVRRYCEIIWQKESDVGVKFLEEKAPGSSVATPIQTLDV